MPADGPERFRVVEEVEHRGPHFGIGALADDDHHFLEARAFDQLPGDVGSPDGVARFGGQTSELANGLGADVGIRIRPGDVAERGHIVETCDSGAAHARFGVLARKRAEHVALFGAQVIDCRRTHRRVRMLPTGLWAEPLENSHADRGVPRVFPVARGS